MKMQLLFNYIAYGRLEIGLLQRSWKFLERMWFLQPLQANSGTVSQVDHHRCLPHPSQFTIRYALNIRRSKVWHTNGLTKKHVGERLFVKLIYLRHSHYLIHFPPRPPAGLSVRKVI
jgi:hypothetical protein